jgi:hypothetical protein
LNLSNSVVFADRSFRLLRRMFDRLFVPVENRTLNATFFDGKTAIGERLDQSISRGIDWFSHLPGLEMTSIIALKTAFDAGLEPQLAFVNFWFEAYRQRFNNPDLRLFDQAYDPESPARSHLKRIRPNHPMNDVMLKCLMADRNGIDDGLWRELTSLDDNGMYGTTHILWGAIILRYFGAAPESKLNELIDKAVPVVCKRQSWDRCCDHFAERMLFLQWLGRHDLVEPAWAMRLAAGQQTDGGWTRHPSIYPQYSNQHTSAMAVAALITFRANQQTGWSSASWQPPASP